MDAKTVAVTVQEEISEGERLMLSVFAVFGLLAMGIAVGLMGLGMHFLPGAN
jgi:hypothetical protein